MDFQSIPKLLAPPGESFQTFHGLRIFFLLQKNHSHATFFFVVALKTYEAKLFTPIKDIRDKSNDELSAAVTGLPETRQSETSESFNKILTQNSERCCRNTKSILFDGFEPGV